MWKIKIFRLLITFSIKSSAVQAVTYTLSHPDATRKINEDAIPNDCLYIK
jgi:hypothetical protein